MLFSKEEAKLRVREVQGVSRAAAKGVSPSRIPASLVLF